MCSFAFDYWWACSPKYVKASHPTFRSVAKGLINPQGNACQSCNGFHKTVSSCSTKPGPRESDELLASIVVIGTDPSIPGTLRRCLAEMGHIVSVCADGPSAVRAFAALSVDLVCVDYRDGGLDAVDFCRWLCSDRARASIPVLFVLPESARWTAASFPSVLRPGSDDYVATPIDLDQLEQKIARLLSCVVSGNAGRALVLLSPPFALEVETHDLRADGRKVRLTPIESKLLAYMMERPESVISTEELLVGVWAHHPGTGDATVVRAHIRNLRNKMAALGRPNFIQTLPQRGYRLLAEKGG